MRFDNFSIPFLSSVLIHGWAILFASLLFQTEAPSRQNYFPVRLSETLTVEPGPLKPAAPEKPSPLKPTFKTEPTLPATQPQEPAKNVDTKTAAPAASDSPASGVVDKHGEDGGSPAGAIASSGSGNAAVVSGTGGAGGGTAFLGLGRSAGAPGSPAQQVFRASREAKPLQTARANYPPMALRSGLESDVILKIEVDPQGNVTKAEIVKSGGSGFDEEALKAVKQSRFEPAQRNGENVAAEFTYVYRFRIRR